MLKDLYVYLRWGNLTFISIYLINKSYETDQGMHLCKGEHQGTGV